jgi:hypothetical protein
MAQGRVRDRWGDGCGGRTTGGGRREEDDGRRTTSGVRRRRWSTRSERTSAPHGKPQPPAPRPQPVRRAAVGTCTHHFDTIEEIKVRSSDEEQEDQRKTPTPQMATECAGNDSPGAENGSKSTCRDDIIKGGAEVEVVHRLCLHHRLDLPAARSLQVRTLLLPMSGSIGDSFSRPSASRRPGGVAAPADGGECDGKGEGRMLGG